MLTTAILYDLVIGLDRSGKKVGLGLIEKWVQTIDTAAEALHNWLPQLHSQYPRTRLLQQLVRHRRAVVDERTGLANRLQALLEQYSDENLPATASAFDSVPSFLEAPSQIASQKLGAGGHCLSQRVTRGGEVGVPQTTVRIARVAL